MMCPHHSTHSNWIIHPTEHPYKCLAQDSEPAFNNINEKRKKLRIRLFNGYYYESSKKLTQQSNAVIHCIRDIWAYQIKFKIQIERILQLVIKSNGRFMFKLKFCYQKLKVVRLPQLLLLHPISSISHVYTWNFQVFPINEYNTFSPQHLWFVVLEYLMILINFYSLIFIVFVLFIKMKTMKTKTYVKPVDLVFDYLQHEWWES